MPTTCSTGSLNWSAATSARKHLMPKRDDINSVLVIGSGPIVIGQAAVGLLQHRSAERRVGQECVSSCRSRWSPYYSKTNTHHSNIHTTHLHPLLFSLTSTTN